MFHLKNLRTMKVFLIKRTFVRLFEGDKLDVIIDSSFPFCCYAFDSLREAQRFCMDLGAKPVEDSDECVSYEEKFLYGGVFTMRYDIVELSRVIF